MFAHEILRCQPNKALDLLDLANISATTAYEQFGWKLVGAWSTAMRDDDEAILLWALPDWQSWAQAEAAQRSDDGLLAWRSDARRITTDWQRILLVAAPLCPFRTGRHPTAKTKSTGPTKPGSTDGFVGLMIHPGFCAG